MQFLPPLVPEKIFCLAEFLGETGSSGHDPGFDEEAKNQEIINYSGTIQGRESRHIPDSRSWLRMGDSGRESWFLRFILILECFENDDGVSGEAVVCPSPTIGSQESRKVGALFVIAVC